jgi:polyphosphate kinase 2
VTRRGATSTTPKANMQRSLNRFHKFDLDDPVLPDWIKKEALASGGHPYAKSIDRDVYQEELTALQIELVKLLDWQKETGLRSILLFEGRDAAGKGGSIKVVREHLNPRQARIVALAKPSDRETGQWYFQRYAAELPAASEMVLFDRSWYNRGVVEPVMGFCTPEQTHRFLEEAPDFERMFTNGGIRLFKFWLEIGREMQLKRFHERRHDPLKSWKVSTVDIAAINRWQEFSEARDRMIAATHTRHGPWIIVKANDKRRAHLALIRYALLSIDYPGRDKKAIGKVDKKILGLGPKALFGMS